MSRIDKLEYALAHDKVPEPRRGSEQAAGFDLGLAHDIVLHPGETRLVDLGVAFDIPEEHYLRVVARSNMCDAKTQQGTFKNIHFIVLRNKEGVIDSDYTGNIKLRLTNEGSEAYMGYQGDYIVQAILQEYAKVSELKKVDKINKQTKRGEEGFGSTNE